MIQSQRDRLDRLVGMPLTADAQDRLHYARTARGHLMKATRTIARTPSIAEGYRRRFSPLISDATAAYLLVARRKQAAILKARRARRAA